MRTKSAYREKPSDEIPEPVTVPSDGLPAIEPQPESNPEAVQAEQVAIEADAAAIALKAQLAAHRQAEALQSQHQQAAAMAQQQAPTSREEKLAMWKTQGMSEAEERFLAEHPLMVDHPTVLTQAIATTTRAGVSRDAPEFLSKVKQNFDVHLNRFQRQAAAASPEFFRPEAPRISSQPSVGSFVSAPVSRDVVGADRPSIPTKVTLTAEEKDAAKFSGISERQYAENKLKMLGAKARGEIS
jgi:hypothetical protein